MKQFQMNIFFASVIEMLCDGEFEGLNIHFREGTVFADSVINTYIYLFKSFFANFLLLYGVSTFSNSIPLCMFLVIFIMVK